MSCGIYKWTSPSGKSYIGQSINLERRYDNFLHCKYYTSGLSAIDNARKKYPDFEQWTYEILEECEPNELNDREQFYINLFNTQNNGYNDTSGGDNNFVRTEEFKQRLSVSRMGEKNPMYGKPSWNKDIPMSEKAKEKLSKANKGKVAWNRKRIAQYALDDTLSNIWESAAQIQKELGFCHSHIIECCKGKLKSAYGFIWRYHN